jgi:hypothetical protein
MIYWKVWYKFFEKILHSFGEIFFYEKIPLKLSIFDTPNLRSGLTLLFTKTSDSTHFIS